MDSPSCSSFSSDAAGHLSGGRGHTPRQVSETDSRSDSQRPQSAWSGKIAPLWRVPAQRASSHAWTSFRAPIGSTVNRPTEKERPMKLDGNTILITGGTSGIGLELAKEFLKRGNVVMITGRDQERLERAKTQLPQLHTFQSDVSRIEDIDALHARVTKEFPALNILVNNAGVMRTINLHSEEQSLEELTREIDINFKGPVWM